jgi:hypothetical protein
MLALVQPSEAKVVYTPTHKWLPVNQYFYFDFNHDGGTAFRFFLGSRVGSTTGSLSLRVRPGMGSGAKKAVYSYRSAYVCGISKACAAALPEGVKVGPNSPFLSTKSLFMFGAFWNLCSNSYFGQWLDEAGQAYVGLKFVIKGKTHYGWARMGHISGRSPVKALLTGYAYETIPNKAILTGEAEDSDVITAEPATLGRLALGRR